MRYPAATHASEATQLGANNGAVPDFYRADRIAHRKRRAIDDALDAGPFRVGQRTACCQQRGALDRVDVGKRRAHRITQSRRGPVLNDKSADVESDQQCHKPEYAQFELLTVPWLLFQTRHPDCRLRARQLAASTSKSRPSPAHIQC